MTVLENDDMSVWTFSSDYMESALESNHHLMERWLAFVGQVRQHAGPDLLRRIENCNQLEDRHSCFLVEQKCAETEHIVALACLCFKNGHYLWNVRQTTCILPSHNERSSLVVGLIVTSMLIQIESGLSAHTGEALFTVEFSGDVDAPVKSLLQERQFARQFGTHTWHRRYRPGAKIVYLRNYR